MLFFYKISYYNNILKSFKKIYAYQEKPQEHVSTIRNQNVFRQPLHLPTAQVRTNSAVHNSVKINKVILKARAIGRWAVGGRVLRAELSRRQKRSSRAGARALLLINAQKTDLLCRVEKIIGTKWGQAMEGQEWRGDWHHQRQLDGQWLILVFIEADDSQLFGYRVGTALWLTACEKLSLLPNYLKKVPNI